MLTTQDPALGLSQTNQRKTRFTALPSTTVWMSRVGPALVVMMLLLLWFRTMTSAWMTNTMMTTTLSTLTQYWHWLAVSDGSQSVPSAADSVQSRLTISPRGKKAVVVKPTVVTVYLTADWLCHSYQLTSQHFSNCHSWVPSECTIEYVVNPFIPTVVIWVQL